MTTIDIDIPESLLRRAKTLAENEGLSLDQFIAIALSGQIASFETAREIEECGTRRAIQKLD